MPRLNLPVSIILLFLFFILLGQSFFEVKGRIRRLELLGAEVGTLRDRKAELEEELIFRQSPAYIEKEAREQLGYAKKGEVIVVLPDWEEEKKDNEGEVAAADSSEGTFSAEKELLIWERWRCLCFPSSGTCP